MKNWMLAAALILLASCTGKKDGGAAQPKASQPQLTRLQAEERAKQIANISYVQQFALGKDQQTFSGSVDIAFDWKVADLPLQVDFFNGKILHTRFNGHDVDVKYDGKELTIDPCLADAWDPAHLAVEFEHGY